jgi:hypothetical protein
MQPFSFLNHFGALSGPTRARLANDAEVMLLAHFDSDWRANPPLESQRSAVVRLIRERVTATSDDVLRSLLDSRVAPMKTAEILDKVVDEVYGGNSVFFFRALVKGARPRGDA